MQIRLVLLETSLAYAVEDQLAVRLGILPHGFPPSRRKRFPKLEFREFALPGCNRPGDLCNRVKTTHPNEAHARYRIKKASRGRAGVSTRKFRITVRGTLGERFASMFDGMLVENRPGEAVLIGDLDQSQLHGVIDRLGDFGLELLRLEEVS